MPAPTSSHQLITGFIYAQLFNHVTDNKGPCLPMISPVDVQLDCDDKTMVEPDILVVCDQGSQIFEAVGISSEVIDRYFTGTVSRIEGITLEDIEDDVERLHSQAFDPLGLSTELTLDSVGVHKMRSQGEKHRITSLGTSRIDHMNHHLCTVLSTESAFRAPC